MKDFLDQFIPALVTGIIGLGAVIMEKRKKRAEVQQVESDAIQAMQNAYKTFVADLNGNYNELKLKIEKLEAEVLEWKQKYYELKKDINNIDTDEN
jgi:predicted RNase H-like nuclease (RuvC/YqgF family)